MADRKVVNKYYPPDFDPSAVKRIRRPKGEAAAPNEVRLMLPFTICCSKCNEFIYRGKKFNGTKEIVAGETYLGVKIHRFFLKCPMCSNSIQFKTDPKNTDYLMEKGAKRNFEPHKIQREIEENIKNSKFEEEKDAMKKLENKAAATKKEVELEEEIERFKKESEARFARDKENFERGKFESREKSAREAKEEEEDKKLAEEAFKNAKMKNNQQQQSGGEMYEKQRIENNLKKLLEIEINEENENEENQNQNNEEIINEENILKFHSNNEKNGKKKNVSTMENKKIEGEKSLNSSFINSEEFSSDSSAFGFGGTGFFNGIVVKKRKIEESNNSLAMEEKKIKINSEAESVEKVSSESNPSAPVSVSAAVPPPTASLSSLMAGYSDSDEEEN